MKITANLWLGIGILVILSPLGVILPEYFKAGSAWGEWKTKLSGLWNAPLPDYYFGNSQGKSLLYLSFTYILCALLGIVVIVIIVLIIGRILAGKRGQHLE